MGAGPILEATNVVLGQGLSETTRYTSYPTARSSAKSCAPPPGHHCLRDRLQQLHAIRTPDHAQTAAGSRTKDSSATHSKWYWHRSDKN